MAEKKLYSSLDITKYILAVLVIGIHTQPFSFNIWLDRGFAIITRICVPFFFVTSAYLFWKSKGKSATKYVFRISLLYVLWSLIYLPFDINAIQHMSCFYFFKFYFWIGGGHELWYLPASVVGFFIVFFLLKIFKPRTVFLIAAAVLLIGCLGSTWSPLIGNNHFVDIVVNHIGYRTGLFYGFPYIALGMFLAKTEERWIHWKNKFLYLGFLGSLVLLIIESFIFVVYLKTGYTVLWISVLPLIAFLFFILVKENLPVSKTFSVFLRNMSTVVYVSQSLFLMTISVENHMVRFVSVALCASVLAAVIVFLSRFKWLQFLRFLY